MKNLTWLEPVIKAKQVICYKKRVEQLAPRGFFPNQSKRVTKWWIRYITFDITFRLQFCTHGIFVTGLCQVENRTYQSSYPFRFWWTSIANDPAYRSNSELIVVRTVFHRNTTSDLYLSCDMPTICQKLVFFHSRVIISYVNDITFGYFWPFPFSSDFTHKYCKVFALLRHNRNVVTSLMDDPFKVT